MVDPPAYRTSQASNASLPAGMGITETPRAYRYFHRTQVELGIPSKQPSILLYCLSYRGRIHLVFHFWPIGPHHLRGPSTILVVHGPLKEHRDLDGPNTLVFREHGSLPEHLTLREQATSFQTHLYGLDAAYKTANSEWGQLYPEWS
jgi:hypothetical protein